MKHPPIANSASDLCHCGCGHHAGPGNRFLPGHWSRTPEARANYTARRKFQTPVNPDGKCQCGCGELTPIATQTKPGRGYYKGQHVRYLLGHQTPRGVAAPNWQGGRTVHASGYVYVYTPNHPHANSYGYVFEHRLVMEKVVGRFLRPEERVHHKNHKRGDNHPENLHLYASHTEHVRDEHSQTLNKWRAAHPERSKQQQIAAGKKGAAKRWKK